MSKLPAWFRLNVNWYADDVLVAAADASGYRLTTFALWPVLIAMAKDASSPANTAGEFTTTPRKLAKAIGTNEREVGMVLARLREGELLTLKRGKLGVLRVRLAGFEKWQTAKGTNAEFVAKSKANKQAVSADTTGLGQESERVGTTETRDRRVESRSNEKPDSGKPNRGPARSDITSVIEHFDAERAKRPGTRALKWDQKRRNLVRSRLASGFTVEDLQHAATAMLAADWPWQTGNATPDHVYRNTANVEKYLEQSARSNPSGVPEGVRILD